MTVVSACHAYFLGSGFVPGKVGKACFSSSVPWSTSSSNRDHTTLGGRLSPATTTSSISATPAYATTDSYWVDQNETYDSLSQALQNRYIDRADTGAFAPSGFSGNFGGGGGRGEGGGSGGSGKGGGGNGGFGSSFGGFSDGQGVGLYFLGVQSVPNRKSETLGKALWHMVSAASLLQTICFLLYTDHAQTGEFTNEDGFDEAELYQ